MDELRSALVLATDEELLDLTELLFRPKFNPLDYVTTPSPVTVQGYDRAVQLNAIEKRFRFLAADGLTVLKGQTRSLNYRQVLMQICRHLKIAYTSDFTTIDLESEILLSLLQQACRKLSTKQYQDFNGQLQKALDQSELCKQLPEGTRREPLRLLITGGGVLAISSIVRPWLLRQITQQWAIHTARCLAAREVLASSGGILAHLHGRMVLAAASREVAVNAARYSAVRSVFSVISPALWGWLLLDLGWRSIAINYSRVIPFVFVIAQIRLTRSSV